MIKNFKKIISVIAAIAFCFLSVPVDAIDSSIIRVIYTAEYGYGKVFADGKNEPIFDETQFDILLSNLSIESKDNSYELSFDFESNRYVINGKLVSAKANNVERDHYLLSPSTSYIGKLSFVNISLTTSANQYDVIPVNTDLIGKAIITIILRDDVTNDIYYWQLGLTRGELYTPNLNLSRDEQTIDKANEFYYAKNAKSVNCCSEDDIPSERVASYEEYEELKNRDLTSTKGATTHNPYYDLGIPDDIFKNPTETWQWLAAGPDQYGNYLPIRYYAYCYTLYGNPNIMTHIMIIGRIWQKDNSITSYTENGSQYAKTSAMMKIELFRLPHTVVYYTGTNNFDFMLGGEELTQIEEPGIQIKKSSSNIPHVVVSRYEFSNAAKKGNFLNLGALVLKEVAVGVLDLPSYGFASVLVDIFELIGNASTSVGANDGYVPIEEYYSSAAVQQAAYGYVMGSVKSTVRGYLRVKNQYFGTRVWFATPYANRAQVNSLTWIYYVSASFR